MAEKEKEVAVANVAKCFGGVYERLKELEVEQEDRRKEDGTDVSTIFQSIALWHNGCNLIEY